MLWTIESALNENSLEEPRKLISEYKFRLRDLSTEITIRLYEIVGGTGVAFEQSHFIHTPSQAGPYRTSRPWGDYEAYALHLAVTSLTQYYDQAVKEGGKPVETWLVPNSRF